MSPATLTKPTVNLVSKSQLAKLLATENITIEHSAKAHTASFDTNRRKLTLPIWNKASEDVYDMLVAHEVGHALITPKEGVYMPICERVCPKNPAKFFGYLNIVEDIRVDLYIKNSFPGVRRSYFNAFNELLKGDFFDLKTRPLSSLAFGDRVNVYAKAGQYGFLDVPFSAEEQVIVDDAMKVSTFDEVAAVAERIYNQSKKPEQAPAPQPTDAAGQQPPCEDGQGGDDQGEADADGSCPEPQTDGESSSNNNEDESDEDSDAPSAGNGQEDSDSDSDQSDDAQDDGDNKSNRGNRGGSAPSDKQDEIEQDAPDLKTDTAANKAFNDLQDHSKNADYAYKNMPRINLDAVIFDYKTVLSDLSPFESSTNYSGATVFAKIQERNKSFVLNLVKQFEQKMAADTVRRTKYSRTGALDMRRISNYKFSDDLFLKNATVQSGKNHGMVFIMDWSGSMGDYLLPTVEQLIALCLFCRRMNIPFEVFAFTNSVPNRTDDQKFGYGEYEKQHDAMIAAQALISPDYTISKTPGEYSQLNFNGFLEVHGIGMINFLSSKMSAQDFKKGAELFCQLAVNCDYSGCELAKGTTRVNSPHNIEKIYSLSGTPLTESAFVAIDIVNRFKVQNRLDIVNTVFLTDGEPSSSIGAIKYSSGNIVVNMPNRKQKMVYSQDITQKYSTMYSTSIELIGIIEIFRELTGSNAISIHLTSKRGSKMLADRYALGNLQKSIDLQQEWKDNDFFSVKDIGFTESFVIDAKSEIVDPDDIFEGLKDNASDAVIARTFIKGNQKQSTSRVLLNRFSDLIAKKVLA